MKTTVYRVENGNGIGPYDSGFSYSIGMGVAHINKKTHPGPFDDGIDNFDHYHFCGFESMEKLLVWFQGYLPALYKGGFKIVKFEIEDIDDNIIKGRKQLMFRKMLAKKNINHIPQA